MSIIKSRRDPEMEYSGVGFRKTSPPKHIGHGPNGEMIVMDPNDMMGSHERDDKKEFNPIAALIAVGFALNMIGLTAVAFVDLEQIRLYNIMAIGGTLLINMAVFKFVIDHICDGRYHGH